jgi:hypothetical protein
MHQIWLSRFHHNIIQHNVRQQETTSKMMKGDQVILRRRRSADTGQLNIVNMPVEHGSFQDIEVALLTQESTELWHQQLAHTHKKRVEELGRQGLIKDINSTPKCSDCNISKAH